MFCKTYNNTGKQVAREMYGCSDPQAWVAHGFLDDRLQGWPYGDNQWALCVTCGAWAALAIWEHMLITPMSVPLLVEVITVLRGIVKFFMEYMLREAGADGGYTMHTGPTTSPENSYVILYSGVYCRGFVCCGVTYSIVCICRRAAAHPTTGRCSSS